MYLDRMGQRVAVCMFTIVAILAVYAVAQRIGWTSIAANAGWRNI